MVIGLAGSIFIRMSVDHFREAIFENPSVGHGFSVFDADGDGFFSGQRN
jgi:hypothetical protein